MSANSSVAGVDGTVVMAVTMGVVAMVCGNCSACGSNAAGNGGDGSDGGVISECRGCSDLDGVSVKWKYTSSSGDWNAQVNKTITHYFPLRIR